MIWNTRSLGPCARLTAPPSLGGRARAPAPTDYKEEEEGAQPERPSKGYSLRRHLRAVLVRPQLQATPTATWRPLAGNLWAAGRFLKLPIDRSRSIDRPEREAASHRTLSKRRSAIAILSSEKSRRAMQWAWVAAAAAARRYRGPIRPPGKPETVAVARSSLPLTASLLQEEGAVGEGGHGTGYLAGHGVLHRLLLCAASRPRLARTTVLQGVVPTLLIPTQVRPENMLDCS